MDKYKVTYSRYGWPHPCVVEIEASGVWTKGDTIIFLDEYGEDDYVFLKKDVISYYEI